MKTDKIKPSKRVKTWHRNAMKDADDRDKVSLRAFIRTLTGSDNRKAIADRWFAEKVSR